MKCERCHSSARTRCQLCERALCRKCMAEATCAHSILGEHVPRRDGRNTGRPKGKVHELRCRWCATVFPVWTGQPGARVSWQDSARQHAAQRHPIEYASALSPLALISKEDTHVSA